MDQTGDRVAVRLRVGQAAEMLGVSVGPFGAGRQRGACGWSDRRAASACAIARSPAPSPNGLGIGREVESPIRLGGQVLPRGTTVLVSPWVLGRDARWFPDPERFDPGRWLDGRSSAIPRHAYIPFGVGAAPLPRRRVRLAGRGSSSSRRSSARGRSSRWCPRRPVSEPASRSIRRTAHRCASAGRIDGADDPAGPRS